MGGGFTLYGGYTMNDLNKPMCFSRVSTVFSDDELEHISWRLRRVVFFGCLPHWGECRVDESNAVHAVCVQATENIINSAQT